MIMIESLIFASTIIDMTTTFFSSVFEPTTFTMEAENPNDKIIIMEVSIPLAIALILISIAGRVRSYVKR